MKKSRVLWQNNTEFEQILPLEQFFKYHFSSATSEKKEEGRPLMKIFNYPKGHTPVSYTHLDVYKRQSIFFKPSSDWKPSII